MQDQSPIVELLNDLIIVNHDRTHGYHKAAKEIKVLALKGLFEALAKDSRIFASELSIKVSRLGGTPGDETSTAGTLYKAWMAINFSIRENDRKNILKMCEEGENVALAAYAKTLESTALSSGDLHQLIFLQNQKLREGRDSLRHLRDNVYA